MVTIIHDFFTSSCSYYDVHNHKKNFDIFMGKITHILEPKITTSVLGMAID